MASVEELAAYIRQRQRELGLGQNELARECGMSQGTLANLLAGRVTKAPSLSTIERLARGLQVEPSQLLNLVLGTGAKAPPPHEPSPAPGPAAPDESGAPSPRAASTALIEAEQAILRRAEAHGIYWHCQVDPALLALPPEDRYPLFQLLDSFVHFVKLYRGLPPGSSED